MPEIKIHRDELQYLSGCTSWNCCIGLEVALPCKDQLTSLCEKRLAALDEQGVLHLDLALQHCLQVIQRSLQSLCIGFVSADGEDRVLLHVGEREYVLRYYDHQSGDVRMAADRLQTLPFVLQACGALLADGDRRSLCVFAPTDHRDPPSASSEGCGCVSGPSKRCVCSHRAHPDPGAGTAGMPHLQAGWQRGLETVKETGDDHGDRLYALRMWPRC